MVLSSRGDTIASREFRRPLPAAAVREVADEVRRRSEALGSAAALPGDRAEFAPEQAEIAGPLARAAGGHPRRRRAAGLAASPRSTPAGSGTSIA